jgi:hypothetical protein
MLEGFDFGTPKIADQLSGKLAALKHYNALSIPRHTSWKPWIRCEPGF